MEELDFEWSNSGRDMSIDVTKGIGIFLVILGHCPEIPDILRQYIFSFHMPLFFIISGLLYKPKGFRVSIISDLKRIMVPYFTTCLIIIIFYLLVSLATGTLNSHVVYYVKAAFVGSGSAHGCRFLHDLPSIGGIWFLPALFICRNTYNLLMKLHVRRMMIIVLIISILSTYLGRNVIYVPMSALSGLSALVFFGIGDALKSMTKINCSVLVIGIACYMISFLFSSILLVQPQMDLYPFDVVGATTMSALVLFSSKMICRKHNNFVTSSLSWLGRYSLIVLCFHILEQDCGVTHALVGYMGDSPFPYFMCRTAFPLIASYGFVSVMNIIADRRKPDDRAEHFAGT